MSKSYPKKWLQMCVVVKGVTYMTTNKEKETIFSLREQGYMLKEIAEMTGKSLSLVKKYVAENNKQTAVCINCGKRMEPGHFKPKKFCCDKCKREYYKKHPECVHKKKFKKHICPCCGKEFFSYGKPNRKFCSRTCSSRSRFVIRF